MADERGIKATLLEIKTAYGEPFEFLYKSVTQAWAELPPECRETAWIELPSLEVYYYRPQTEEDKRDLAEYERLKAKFRDTEYE